MSTREIADRLGVTQTATWKALNPDRTRELDARSRERHREKRRAYDRARADRARSICDICGETCGSGSALKGVMWCQSCVIANSAARDDQIVTMYQEGVPLIDMAARLGWTKGRLSWQIGRLRGKGRIGYRHTAYEQKQKV